MPLQADKAAMNRSLAR